MKNSKNKNRSILAELFNDNEVKPGYSRMGMFDRPGPNINTVKTVMPELPLSVMPQMATQLSIEMPPIDDDDYYPASNNDLALALQALAKRVPNKEARRVYNIIRNHIEKKYGQANDEKVGNMTENLKSIIRQLIRENKKNYKNYKLSNLLFEKFEIDKVDGSASLEKKDYKSPFNSEGLEGTTYRILSVKDFLDFLDDPNEETSEVDDEDISLLSNYEEDIVDFFVDKQITHWDYDLNSKVLYGYIKPNPTPIVFNLTSQSQEENEIETPSSQKSNVPSSLTYAGYSLRPEEKTTIEILDNYVDLYSAGQEKDLIKSRLGFLKYSGVSFSSSNDVKWVWHDRKASMDTLDSLAASLNFIKNKTFKSLGLSKKDIIGQGSESKKYVEKSNYIVYVQRYGFDHAVIIKESKGDNYIILENNEVTDMRIKDVANPMSDIDDSVKVFKIQNMQNQNLPISRAIISRASGEAIGRPGYDFSANEMQTYEIAQRDEIIDLIENYYNKNLNFEDIDPQDTLNNLFRKFEEKYGELKYEYLSPDDIKEILNTQKLDFSQSPEKGTSTIRAIVRRGLQKANLLSLAKSAKIESAKKLQLNPENTKKYHKLIQYQFEEILSKIITKLENSGIINKVKKDDDLEELVFEVLAMSNNEKIRQYYYSTVQHKSVGEYEIPLSSHVKLLKKGYTQSDIENFVRAIFSSLYIFVGEAKSPIKMNKKGFMEVSPVNLMIDGPVSTEVSRIEDINNKKQMTESYNYFNKFMVDINNKNNKILNESRQKFAAENQWKIRDRAAREREHHLHAMRIKNEQ